MNETLKKIIYYAITLFVTGCLAFVSVGFCVQTYRLDKTRVELNNVRVQLAAASYKQQRIADIVRGTDEILSETFTTVAGIRSQIAAIRESYEEMEKLLYSGNSNNISDNDTNLQKTKVGDYNEQ